jgi:hypothetical protein
LARQVTLSRFGARRSANSARSCARIATYLPQELTGNMQEGDRKVIVLADDIAGVRPSLCRSGRSRIASSWLDGRSLVIQSVDDTTRRVAGVLVAFELRVSGN